MLSIGNGNHGTSDATVSSLPSGSDRLSEGVSEALPNHAFLPVEAFCAEMSSMLVGALTVRVGNRYLAEEIAQEALVKAVMKWDTIREMDNPHGYVFRTAFNIAASYFRRFKSERRALERSSQERRPQLVSSDVQEFGKLIQSLSRRQQEVLILRYFADMTLAQTADTLGISTGSVKTLAHRALRKLRAEFPQELESSNAFN